MLVGPPQARAPLDPPGLSRPDAMILDRFKLSDKVAIVTGAGRRIGAAFHG